MDEQAIVNNRMKRARKARKTQLANKGKETYLNKEWLFSRRCIDKMSLDRIGKLCNVEYDVIWQSLKKFNIPLLIMVGRDNWCEWIEKHRNKIAYRTR